MELLDLFNFRLPDFGNIHFFEFNKNTLFIVLNASIIWAVLSYLLLRLTKLKTITLILIFLPLLSINIIDGFPVLAEFMGLYSVSIIYGGLLGILIGMSIGEYHNIRAFYNQASKIGFFARSATSLSGVYLLGTYGKSVLFDNPVVTSTMSFLGLGDPTDLAQIDQEGLNLATTVFVSGVGVSLFEKYRRRIPTRWIKGAVTSNHTKLKGKKAVKNSRNLSIVLINRFKKLPWVHSIIEEMREIEAKEKEAEKSKLEEK